MPPADPSTSPGEARATARELPSGHSLLPPSAVLVWAAALAGVGPSSERSRDRHYAGAMFILELTYTASAERIDALLPEHVAWLEKQYEAGVFLASGRKAPREGGVILAVGEDRAGIEALAATDPFAVQKVADYRIIEFLATKTAPALAPYRQQLPPA